MSFNYKLFKEHINCFDFENYIKKSSDIFQLKYNDFYIFYVKIIKDEIEKTKQLNAKFTKNINDKNNSKFHKFNRNLNTPIEFKKVCSFESIGDEDEKLNIIIRTYLNKISTYTYEKVTDQLIEKLLENKNTNIFKILSEEIVNKCIYDYKYRNLYINLCAKIWNNKKIHFNLITINKVDNKYYASYNTDNNSEDEKIGPYDSIDKLKDYVFRKINFKNFFVDFIQELYYNKELDFENLNDEKFFNIKKKTLLLVELLSILFVERHINFDIINLIIIDLLHQDDNFNLIREIEFELLHVMIKFIYKNNKSFKFIEYKKIIAKFKEILENTISKNNSINISKRSLYFIEEIITFFKKIINNERYEHNKKDINNIENIIGYADAGNSQLFKENLITLNNTEQKNILIKIINSSLEKVNKNMIKCIKHIKYDYINIIENTMINIINNLDDIILDIPNINENIKTFIKDLGLNNNLLKKLEEKMETIDNQSDDEDFSFR